MAVEMKFLNNRTRYAEFFMDDDSTEISKLPNIDRAGQDNLSTVSGIAQGSKAMLTNSATTYYRLKGDGNWVKIIDEGGGGGGSDVTKEYVDEQLSYKVDKQNGKSLSTNDFTNTYRLKLDGIEEGAEVNVIAGITLNGSPLTPSNKIVALNVLTKSVNDLENYYLKTETYTKSEVDALVNAISTLTLDVVDELPTEDISTTTIYLIKVEGSDNVYQQYVYINNAWAQLGTTEVDLSNYYTKAQIDTLLLAKQDILIFDDIPTVSSNNPVKSGGIYNALAAKQDTLTFDNVPTSGSNNPVKSGGIYSALENKQNTLTFDNVPTHGSDNVVTSGAIADAIANAETPIATENTAGKVKPDGSTITVDQDGTIHAVGGGTQVQSDWGQVDTTAVDYIKNKPDLTENLPIIDTVRVMDTKPKLEDNIGIATDVTFSGISGVSGSYIWTDGDDVYFSNNTYQYVLDKETLTWSEKTWTGFTNITAALVWTDGDNIYYSSGTDQYVLDKATSTWSVKAWNGLTDFSGHHIWTDGNNIYLSNDADQYVLDKATSTWSTKSWVGLTGILGYRIWSDGDNVYYSYDSIQYVLDKATSTWTEKTWSGLTSFKADNVWTDGNNIYHSINVKQYVLDKDTSTWLPKTWEGLSSFSGSNVWTDGNNIYYSYGSTSKKLINRTVQDNQSNNSGSVVQSDWNETDSTADDYIKNKPTIPEETQSTILPTPSADLVGKIYQYIGNTTLTYTNGWFYKCVQGEIAGTYEWKNVDVQNGSGTGTTVRDEITISTASDFRQSQGSYSFKTSVAVTITLADANTITIPANIQGLFDVGETDTTLNDYIGLIQYTNNGYENKIYFTKTIFYLPSTDSVQIDDNNISSATTYSSAKIETAIGGSKAAQMTGATAYQDGKEGLATKPLAGDNQKALFGDGKYHNIYAANTGSVVIVATDEPTLYGRPVTLTAGSTTLTGTFSDTGECTFSNLAVYGAVSITSSDSEGNLAKGSTNITYFGTYVVGVGFNFATIKFTSTDITLAGTPVAIYLGNLVVAETSLSSDGQGGLQATCYVEQLGTYKAVAQTSSGMARASVTVTALHQTYVKELIVANIYGFKIHKTDSNPATCVTPYDLGDYEVLNVGYTPAHMDYTNDRFDYGSWGALADCDRSQIFFAPKPCMLNYNGTVAYYLDPHDFTKKLDGTSSDIADETFNGNAMVEFPTVWLKRWEDEDYAYVLVSDKQLDIDFHAYAHHDKNGNILNYIYLPMYKGWDDGTRLRSISGKEAMSNNTRQQEINKAIENNTNFETGEGWYILHKSEWDMFNDLLLLIGANFNTQTTFGNGVVTGDSSGKKNSGMFNNKGLFYGRDDDVSAVIVFGVENWWGNLWSSCAGWIYDNGAQKIKLTYGMEDGSTVSGFNVNGSGYVSIAGSTPYGSSGGYISNYKISSEGYIPLGVNGSDSTYCCDVLWYNSNQVNYAIVGGGSNSQTKAGAFCIELSGLNSRTLWHGSASLTYKGGNN